MVDYLKKLIVGNHTINVCLGKWLLGKKNSKYIIVCFKIILVKK